MQPVRLLCIWLLLASFAAAQKATAVEQAESAGGSFHQNFRVVTDANQHSLAQAEAGKAQIYVIEDWNPADKGRINRPTVRVGMDGKWMGANQGDSYLFFLPTQDSTTCVSAGSQGSDGATT